jgi:hypothetical protein
MLLGSDLGKAAVDDSALVRPVVGSGPLVANQGADGGLVELVDRQRFGLGARRVSGFDV